MSPTTSEVYLHVTDNVLDNVIRNFRAELLSQGINDAILDKLQELWESKMEKSGVVQHSTIEEPLPVLGPDEMAEIDALFEPNFTAAHNGSISDSEDGADTQTGRFALDMQQPSPLTSKTPLRLDVNVAYEEEREERGVEVIPKTESTAKDNLPKDFIPWQDKCADAYYNLSAQEVDDGEAPLNESDDGEAPLNESDDGEAPLNESDDGEAPLNESDDGEAPLNESDDVEMDDGDEDPSNLVLAKYNKVSKRKNRWKCLFTDGIMHLNNREILFSKATVEFEF